MLDEKAISSLERIGFATSEQTDQLWQALFKTTSGLANISPKAIAQRATYSYKYIDLGTLLDEVKDKLLANGLLLTQFPIAENREIGYAAGLVTLLVHVASGQYLAFRSFIHADVHQHVFGATVTYTRKYHIQSVLGVCAEMDDDAGAASVSIVPQKTANTKKEEKQPNEPNGQKQQTDHLTIIDVKETKSGYMERKTADGKIVRVPWILFEIHTNNGVFKTFNKDVVAECGRLAGSGKNVAFDFDDRGVVKAVREV